MAQIDEKVLWGAAEKLRDKCPPEDYKNIVLGLVFLKYVSDKYTAKRDELIKEGKDYKDRDEYIAEHVFIVPDKALWSYVSSFSKQPNIGQVIDDAFEAIEKENDQLKNILPKTYSKSDLDKSALGGLIEFFDNNLKMDDVDGDFFGQVYEYYIGAFAKYVPTKGGEFFTPKSIVEMMVEILEPYKGRVYDPCCGSGGMFVQCTKFVKEHQGLVDNISIYGQESNPGNWKMAKMNLAIRGIEGNLGPSHGDSFTNDLHKGLRADYILANPPYNSHDYWSASLEGDPRWIFGRPNDKNGDYAWLELMYSKLAPNGKAAVLLDNGATTISDSASLNIRTNMLKQGKVDAIISLPDKLFANVTLPVQCWIINKAKTNTDVLFINATNFGKMKSRKIRVLSGSSDDETFNTETDVNEIKLIADTYHNYRKNENYENKLGFCCKATLDEIKAKDYSLNPGRYVGVDDSDKLSAEEINKQLKETSEELFKLIDESKELEEKVKEILINEFK